MRPIVRLLAALAATFLLVFSAQAADKAADFTLRDINGKSVSLSEHKGKVVVLAFWATWCGPCKEEMPHLEKLYQAKKDQGLVVLSINTDDARSASRVKPYIRTNGYTFPVLLDRDATVISTYNPGKTLPYTVVVDRNQEIAKVTTSYNPGDEKALAALVDRLL